MTGGRAAIGGFLYQILCTLGRIAHITTQDQDHGTGESSARLVLEPDAGDLQSTRDGVQVVEQFKSRSTGRAWTSVEIVEGVLPDLLAATRSALPNIPLVVRFVTNGRCVADDLRRFISLVTNIADPSAAKTAIDCATLILHLGDQEYTAAEYLSEVARRLRCEIPDDPSLLRLLANFVIEDEADEQTVGAQIDAVLARLVEAREEVENKRNELIGRLLELAKHGRPIVVTSFLEQAGLNPERLRIVQRLPAILGRWLNHAATVFRYDRVLDVRPSVGLGAATRVAVIEGNSGQGKSWRLARVATDLAEQGRLVILLPAEGRLIDIERMVVQRIWHSAGFDRTVPLSNIAERIAPNIPSGDEYWLTLCIDDVQSAQMVRDIAHENWDRLGIRIIVSAETRIANLIETLIANAQRIVLHDFTLRELRNYLERQGREPATIPDDVLALIRRPILASLYCRLTDRAWIPETEYALIDRFWRYATSEYGEQSRHPSDKHFLKMLVSRVLDTNALYPWSNAAAVDARLSDEARQRLFAAGVLKPADSGIVMSHDRLLNWAVAEWLRDQLQQQVLTNQSVGEILHRILRVDGDWTNDFASRRLGYVPMDLLWLLVEAAEHSTAAALLSVLHTHHLRLTEEGLYRDMLPTLGSRILPTLVAMLAQPISSDYQRLIAREAGEAVAILGRTNAAAAADTVQRLLDLDNVAAQAAALTALAKIPAPALLDRLWTIHLTREAEFEASKDRRQGGDFVAVEESFAALIPSSRVAPDWIARTARGPTSRKDQLVYLLMRLPHTQGLQLWQSLRDLLFADVSQNRRCLAQALRAFGTADDVAFLEVWIAEGGDEFDLSTRFDALARLSPERALVCLPAMRQTFLATTTRSWLPNLFLRAGIAANDALLAAFGDTFEGVRDLAMIYAPWQEHLNAATLRRILDVLTERLAEVDPLDEWKPGGEGHLLRLAAHLYRPELLTVLAEYRGHRLEELLVRRAVRLSGRRSRSVDRDNDEFRSVLLKLGGSGLETLVLHELTRASEFARVDGLRAALWVTSPAVTDRLRQMANDPATSKEEQFVLIDVLALLGERDAVVALLRAGASLPLNVLSVSKRFSPLSDGDVKRARDDIATGTEQARLAGMLTLAISGRPDACDALVDLLERAPADSTDARVAVLVLKTLDCYAPALLPKLQAVLLASLDGWAAVADYLVDRAEPDARAPLLAYFAAHTLRQIGNNEILVAFALLQHPDSVDGARQFLRRLAHSPLGRDIQGDLQSEFLKAGDEQARDLLYDLAWETASSRRNAVAVAIRTLATFDQQSAFDAAHRQLRQEFTFEFVKRLLAINSEAGLDIIVNELYDAAPRKDRGLMGRAIRWYVDPAKLEPKLAAMSFDDDPRRRKAACEIAGWQKGDMLAGRLVALAEDNEKVVEAAALDALQRQRHQHIAAGLLHLLISATVDRKWAFLTALVEATDPYLLNWEDDPLSIWTVSNELPLGYEQTLERLMRDAYKVADDVKDPDE